MAPTRSATEAAIQRTTEYNDFITKLAAFHQKRGTHFDPEPKIGARYIDLLHLYNVVVQRGGYDKVTDVKTLWSKIGTDELHMDKNNPTLGFNLKTVYYKNLAAYEITVVHGREPPPKQILEDLTAKGGNLLTRTLENYQPPRAKETNSEASGDDGTPSRDRMASEETPGSGGRARSGLRDRPPARVLFQDTQNSSQPRLSRNVSATSHATSQQNQLHHQPQQHQHSQAPRGASTSYNPSSSVENMSSAVTNYEPRLIRPMEDLRPVVTPGNNANEFARRQRVLAMAGQPPPANRGIILPGTGFDGPNIYVRCLQALKSGIPSEQDYALHHLVKISMERGDKYKFESFAGLAEALIEKLLEVSSLFYKVDWQIDYMPDGSVSRPDTLNGLYGTPDILQKIAVLERLEFDDNIQTEEFLDAMLMINEAGLTLRNMVMLEDNACYVSENALLRDFLSIALNLPELDVLVELKHYALDVAEQLTKYMHFEESDPLYNSLLAHVDSTDRGAILTALRAIGRISMNLEETNNLKGIPLSVIQKIVDWTLLNDEDLAHACLDFLYQYTAVVDNVNFLLENVSLEPLVNQLTRLLQHNAKTMKIDYPIGTDRRLPAPEAIALLPQELYHELLKLEEPERSSVWLRSLFEEDPLESITQIALWQAYQHCFTPAIVETGIPLLPAAEFIKNVSTTFAEKAAAQVQGGITQKFIIKGIRYRSTPVDRNGEEYKKCLWTGQDGHQCGNFFMGPEQMYSHIVKVHLGGVEGEDGKFQNISDGAYTCSWDTCHRFRDEPVSRLAQIASHIKVHLPPKSSSSKSPDSYASKKPSYIVTAPRLSLTFHPTVVDDQNEAAGIPLSAVLVLRNLARNIPKTEAEENALKEEGGVSWNHRLFLPIGSRLFEVMVDNRSLAIYMTDLINAIRDA